MPAPDDLRGQLATAIRPFRLRLGYNAVQLAKAGAPIQLSGGERDDLADALLPVVQAAIDAAESKATGDALIVFAAQHQERLADAWDEGFAHGVTAELPAPHYEKNPHRLTSPPGPAGTEEEGRHAFIPGPAITTRCRHRPDGGPYCHLLAADEIHTPAQVPGAPHPYRPYSRWSPNAGDEPVCGLCWAPEDDPVHLTPPQCASGCLLHADHHIAPTQCMPPTPGEADATIGRIRALLAEDTEGTDVAISCAGYKVTDDGCHAATLAAKIQAILTTPSDAKSDDASRDEGAPARALDTACEANPRLREELHTGWVARWRYDARKRSMHEAQRDATQLRAALLDQDRAVVLERNEATAARDAAVEKWNADACRLTAWEAFRTAAWEQIGQWIAGITGPEHISRMRAADILIGLFNDHAPEEIGCTCDAGESCSVCADPALAAELAHLEATDPAIAEAARRVDEAIHAIVPPQPFGTGWIEGVPTRLVISGPAPHPFAPDPMFTTTPPACVECWAHEGAAWHTGPVAPATDKCPPLPPPVNRILI